MAEWYVAVGGQQRGPLPEEQVAAEIRSGALAPEAYAYGAGLSAWTPISQVPALARYLVEKGSVTVDGVSLTVVAVDDHSFSVGLIPTTLAATTLGHKPVGAPVNLEVDVIAKYVERLLGGAGAGAAHPYGVR